jgi:phospholipid transport system substrate-binding protein
MHFFHVIGTLGILHLSCWVAGLAWADPIARTIVAPFHLAAGTHDPQETRRYLISKGDINLRDEEGLTALHWVAGGLPWVARKTHDPADENMALKLREPGWKDEDNYKQLETLRVLLNRGADVNAQDIKLRTPLHFAIEYNNYEMVKALLENGADKNRNDNIGRSPLRLATDQGKLEIVSLLTGAPPNVLPAKILAVVGMVPSSPTLSQEQLTAMKGAIGSTFDFSRMMRGMLSKWGSLSENDRKEFTILIEKLVTRSHLSSFEQWVGWEITFLPNKEKDDWMGIVGKVVNRGTPGLSSEFEFRLRKVSGEWLVQDFLIDNVSTIENFRRQFSKILRESSYENLRKIIATKVNAPIHHEDSIGQ